MDQLTVDAGRYLAARGIDRETAATFRLGVVTDPEPEHVAYRGMIAIPYLGRPSKDAPLETWQMRFHCFQPHEHNFHGKYNTMKGDSPRLFNTQHLYGSGNVIHLTEGEFDAMILNKIGLPAIAVPGAHSWAPRHKFALAGFSRIFLWADPDEAGAELSHTIRRDLRHTVTIKLEADVTDTYKAGGAGALLAALERGEQDYAAAA